MKVRHLQVQAVSSLGIRNLKGPSAGGIVAWPGLVDSICDEGVICWMVCRYKHQSKLVATGFSSLVWFGAVLTVGFTGWTHDNILTGRATSRVV
jgi:hypothetical protein